MSYKITSINREYLKQNIGIYSIICTHLESAPQNANIRKLQLDELVEMAKLEPSNKYIIFGDLNFTQTDETIKDFNYLEHNNDIPYIPDIYTYDSLINPNAIKPYRSNLDRFYSNFNTKYKITIYTEFDNPSDHYPIILDITI